MENAVEGLKIAVGVMMFVLALSISISSFSQANSAVQAITMLRDRENDYTYVKQTEGFTRTVGIETIIPTMYRAYTDNIEIYFFDQNGAPLTLYYKTIPTNETEQSEELMKDDNGREIPINYIDSDKESHADSSAAIQHLETIIGVGFDNKDLTNKLHNRYQNQFVYSKGIYEEFKDKKFKEELGEYYQSIRGTKIKKRVITYTVIL